MQLNVVEECDVGKLGHNSPKALHLIVESIKLAKADVYHFVADLATTDVPGGRTVVSDIRCGVTCPH